VFEKNMGKCLPKSVKKTGLKPTTAKARGEMPRGGVADTNVGAITVPKRVASLRKCQRQDNSPKKQAQRKIFFEQPSPF
jgi:hypothetical protein